MCMNPLHNRSKLINYLVAGCKVTAAKSKCQPTKPQWTALHALGNRPVRVCTPCVGQPVMLETLPAREAGLAPDAVKPDSKQGGLPSASRKRIKKPKQTARQLQQQNTGAGEVVVISDEEDDDFEPDVKAVKR